MAKEGRQTKSVNRLGCARQKDIQIADRKNRALGPENYANTLATFGQNKKAAIASGLL